MLFFDESFSITLSYTSQPYSEAMAMILSVTYTPCATTLREKAGNIITFAKYEEENLLSENREDAESGEKSNDN